MKNMKKIIAVLLVLAALASLFTACSTKPAESSTTAANPSEPSAAATDPAKETLEPVTLKMYLLGDKPAGFDEVYAKINESSVRIFRRHWTWSSFPGAMWIKSTLCCLRPAKTLI